MKCFILSDWISNTIVTIIFQISDATPITRLFIRILTLLIFSCLVSGAYLFCDLLYCLVGSTRQTSFFLNFDATPIIRQLVRIICRIMMKFCTVYIVWQFLKYIFKVYIWRMANTVVTFIFQIFYATPIIRLLIRVITDLKVNLN